MKKRLLIISLSKGSLIYVCALLAMSAAFLVPVKTVYGGGSGARSCPNPGEGCSDGFRGSINTSSHRAQVKRDMLFAASASSSDGGSNADSARRTVVAKAMSWAVLLGGLWSLMALCACLNSTKIKFAIAGLAAAFSPRRQGFKFLWMSLLCCFALIGSAQAGGSAPCWEVNGRMCCGANSSGCSFTDEQPTDATAGSIKKFVNNKLSPGSSIARAVASQRTASDAQDWFSVLMLTVILFGLLGLLITLLRAQRGNSGWLALSRRRRAILLATSAALLAIAAWPSLNPPSQPGRTQAAIQPASPTATVPNFANALQISGDGTTQIGGVDYDTTGNLYIAGGYTGSVTFDTTPPTTLTSAQDFDVFVAKFNSAGQCQWARQANGQGIIPVGLALDGATALAVDAAGNAYVGGSFVSSLLFKNAAGTTVATLGDSDSDINFEPFVAKYDTGGNLVWAKGGMSGAPDDPEAASDLDAGINSVTDIVVDAAGNPFVAGGFTGVNFLGATVTAAGGQDAYVARLNPANGSPVWVSQADGVGNDAVFGLSADNAGNLYLIGIYDDDLDFPTNPPTTLFNPDQFEDTFVAKYNSAGQCLFAKAISDEEYLDGFHIAANANGEFYIVGLFNGQATFDGITLTDDSELMSAFLVKYSSGGVAQWAREMSQNPSDADIAGVISERVTLDGEGNPIIAGSLADQIVFGRENPATQQIVASAGGVDQFVAKYDAAGNFQWAKQVSGSGSESQNTTYSEAAPVEYIPYRLVRNRATGRMHLTGDFSGTVDLDDITLDSGQARNAYVVELSPAQAAPDLSLTKSDGGTNFVIGQTGSYQITVSNAAEAGATTGAITVADALPNGLTLQAFAGTGWNCTGEGTRNVNCTNNAPLAAGASLPVLTLTVNVTATTPIGPNSIANIATVSTPGETNIANNSGSDSTTVLDCSGGNCDPVAPGLILPDFAEVSDQKPGSVLIFNVYTSSSSAPNAQNTRINITNVNQQRAATVHLFFVDGATCSVADANVCLTANQTTSFLASDFDPGVTGYLVAVAIDRVTGCPVNFNYLIGDAHTKFATGHAGGLTAEAFSALAGANFVCTPQSVTATLRFDGIQYNRAPRALALSSLGSRSNGNDTLIVLNRVGGNLGTGAASLGAVFGNLYDDTENVFSFSVTGGCQLRGSLTNNFPRTTPRFEQAVPAGRTGWMKFWPDNDVGMLGAQFNVNTNSATAGGAFNHAFNLHKLTLTGAPSYVIPVFPPNC